MRYQWELNLVDRRHFYLISFQPGHPSVMLRGVPELGEDAAEDEDPFALADPPGPMLDVEFAGVSRISCWRDFQGLHLRLATDDERAEIARRIGRLRPSDRVFLLQAGTIESYIVARRVYWAEFQLEYSNTPSPFSSSDQDYKDQYPPVGGQIWYAE